MRLWIILSSHKAASLRSHRPPTECSQTLLSVSKGTAWGKEAVEQRSPDEVSLLLTTHLSDHLSCGLCRSAPQDHSCAPMPSPGPWVLTPSLFALALQLSPYKETNMLIFSFSIFTASDATCTPPATFRGPSTVGLPTRLLWPPFPPGSGRFLHLCSHITTAIHHPVHHRYSLSTTQKLPREA